MSKDEAIKQLQGMVVGAEWLSDSMVQALSVAIEELSVDVESVRHGRWIRKSVESDNSSNGYFKVSMVECSECGTCLMGKPNYCPNCGAKMDEEEQDHE